MSKRPELNSFEERLLALSPSTKEIERYRKNSMISAILFSILFTGAVAALDTGNKPLGFHPLLAAALAVYSLFSCAAVANFQRALSAYRGIIEKFTGMKETVIPETSDRRNMFLLTGFFWCLLFAILVLPQIPAKLYFADGALIFFLILSAVLKGRFASHVIAYKKRCAEFL